MGKWRSNFRRENNVKTKVELEKVEEATEASVTSSASVIITTSIIAVTCSSVSNNNIQHH